MLRTAIIMCGVFIVMAGVVNSSSAVAEEDVIAFAVVSELPKDKTRSSSESGNRWIGQRDNASGLRSHPVEFDLENNWKSVTLSSSKGKSLQRDFGYTPIRAIDAAMLPMVLQGVAGDCLLKKALELAPFID